MLSHDGEHEGSGVLIALAYNSRPRFYLRIKIPLDGQTGTAQDPFFSFALSPPERTILQLSSRRCAAARLIRWRRRSEPPCVPSRDPPTLPPQAPLKVPPHAPFNAPP